MRTSVYFRSLGFVLLCVVASLIGCGKDGEQAAGTASAQAKREPLPAATTPSGKLVVAYLALQQSLAGDDAAGARAAFAQVKTTSDDPAAIADAALRGRIGAVAQAGAASKDLAAARKSFAALSVALLDFLRAQANPVSASLHVAHCPMAFDNAGADWLQTSDHVANPYYGSEMLGCGSLGADVKPGQKLVAK